MAFSLLPCTPMATEPHVPVERPGSFWGAEGMQPTSRTPPSRGQDPMNSEKPAVALGWLNRRNCMHMHAKEVTRHDPYRRMPMRSGPLRSISRAAGALCLPLPRMPEAVGVRLRHFRYRPGTAFVLRRGHLKTWTRPTDSGGVSSACSASSAARVFAIQPREPQSASRAAHWTSLSIYGGLHIWTSRKLPGVVIPDGATEFPEEPRERWPFGPSSHHVSHRHAAGTASRVAGSAEGSECFLVCREPAGRLL